MKESRVMILTLITGKIFKKLKTQILKKQNKNCGVIGFKIRFQHDVLAGVKSSN